MNKSVISIVSVLVISIFFTFPASARMFGDLNPFGREGWGNKAHKEVKRYFRKNRMDIKKANNPTNTPPQQQYKESVRMWQVKVTNTQITGRPVDKNGIALKDLWIFNRNSFQLFKVVKDGTVISPFTNKSVAAYKLKYTLKKQKFKTREIESKEFVRSGENNTALENYRMIIVEPDFNQPPRASNINYLDDNVMRMKYMVQGKKQFSRKEIRTLLTYCQIKINRQVIKADIDINTGDIIDTLRSQSETTNSHRNRTKKYCEDMIRASSGEVIEKAIYDVSWSMDVALCVTAPTMLSKEDQIAECTISPHRILNKYSVLCSNQYKPLLDKINHVVSCD